MSFESDKSDSCFTQGARRRRLNRAISLLPAGKKKTLVVFPPDFLRSAPQRLPASTSEAGIPLQSAAGEVPSRVDIPVVIPKDRARSFRIIFTLTVVSCIMPKVVQMI